MKSISLLEAEYVAHSLVREMMEYDEPIADFSTRYKHKLESCLDQPFIRFDGQDLYPTLLDKAVATFYFVIKNHPFENGNKRMAVMLMIYLLYKNGKFIAIPPSRLYDLALVVAKSDAPIDKYLPALKGELEEFITDL